MVLGFGTQALVTVACDSNGRMLVSDLSEKIKNCVNSNQTPLMVCATAGTTVHGAFDPIEEMVDLCKQNKIWLHVDGAWGGPVIFSKEHRHLVKGLEKADSFTFDAHKLLGANLTCSFFMTNDSKILLQANDVSGADYLFHDGAEVIDRGRLSWQCGRQAEALSFWSIWKSVGSDGLGMFVDRLMNVRTESTAWIKDQSRLQLLADPEYLNLCVQIIPPAGSNLDSTTWSLSVRNQLREKNLAMVNYSTSKNGTHFLRLILAHPKIDFATVKQILTWALEIQ